MPQKNKEKQKRTAVNAGDEGRVFNARQKPVKTRNNAKLSKRNTTYSKPQKNTQRFTDDPRKKRDRTQVQDSEWGKVGSKLVQGKRDRLGLMNVHRRVKVRNEKTTSRDSDFARN